MSTNLKDKILGSLVGFAIGDAMGATTEFMTKEQIKQQYGQVNDIIGGGWLNLPRGQVTDDTQMMLCVARGIMNADKPKKTIVDTLSAIATEFIYWLDSNPPDVGNCCRRAITQNRDCSVEFWPHRNIQYQKYSKREDLGNGGLMRCLVPCLLKHPILAIKQSDLTHANETCQMAIRTYYVAINAAVYKGTTPWARPHLMNPTGHVENTLNNALYWSGKSFCEGILGAVNDGGDADTIAALTGGLLGARFGYAEIYWNAANWVDHLDPTVLEALKQVATYVEEINEKS